MVEVTITPLLPTRFSTAALGNVEVSDFSVENIFLILRIILISRNWKTGSEIVCLRPAVVTAGTTFACDPDSILISHHLNAATDIERLKKQTALLETSQPVVSQESSVP